MFDQTAPEVETMPDFVVAPDEDGEVQEWVVAPEQEEAAPEEEEWHGCGCGS